MIINPFHVALENVGRAIEAQLVGKVGAEMSVIKISGSELVADRVYDARFDVEIVEGRHRQQSVSVHSGLLKKSLSHLAALLWTNQTSGRTNIPLQAIGPFDRLVCFHSCFVMFTPGELRVGSLRVPATGSSRSQAVQFCFLKNFYQISLHGLLADPGHVVALDLRRKLPQGSPQIVYLERRASAMIVLPCFRPTSLRTK